MRERHTEKERERKKESERDREKERKNDLKRERESVSLSCGRFELGGERLEINAFRGYNG